MGSLSLPMAAFPGLTSPKLKRGAPVGAFPYFGPLILGGLKVLIGLGLGYGSRVL